MDTIIDLAKFEESIKSVSDEEYRAMFAGVLQPLREKVKTLTGDSWIPYPSLLFAGVILALPSNSMAKALIEERRGFFAPSFFQGDPQEKRLKAIAGEFALTLKFTERKQE